MKDQQEHKVSGNPLSVCWRSFKLKVLLHHSNQHVARDETLLWRINSFTSAISPQLALPAALLLALPKSSSTAKGSPSLPVRNTLFGCCQRVSHRSAALCNWSVSDYFPATIQDRSGTFHSNFCTTLIWSRPTQLQVMDVTPVCWILLAACLFSIVSAGELKREPDFFLHTGVSSFSLYKIPIATTGRPGYSVTTHNNTSSHHSYQLPS